MKRILLGHGAGWLHRRVLDDRGQVLGWALILIIAILIPMSAGLIRLETGRLGRAQLQSIGDAAANAAANTAQGTVGVQVTEHTRTCKTTRKPRYRIWYTATGPVHWHRKLLGYTTTHVCSDSPNQTNTVTVPLPPPGKRWADYVAGQVQCQTSDPTAPNGTWTVCSRIGNPQGSPTWSYVAADPCLTAQGYVQDYAAGRDVQVVSCSEHPGNGGITLVLEWNVPLGRGAIPVRITAAGYPGYANSEVPGS